MTPIDNDKIIEAIASKFWNEFCGDPKRWDEQMIDPHPVALGTKESLLRAARAALTALSSSGYIICQAGDAETGDGSAAPPFQFGDSPEAIRKIEKAEGR